MADTTKDRTLEYIILAGVPIAIGVMLLLQKKNVEGPVGSLRLRAQTENGTPLAAPFQVFDVTKSSTTPAWAGTTSTVFDAPSQKDDLPVSGIYWVFWGGVTGYLTPGYWVAGHTEEGNIIAYTETYELPE